MPQNYSWDNILFQTTKAFMDLENIEAVEYILSHYSGDFNINQPLEERNETLLNYAINFSSVHSYYYSVALIQSGADLNIPDMYGNSPLHKSVILGKNEVKNLLLNNGANQETRNNYCQTYYEIENNSQENREIIEEENFAPINLDLEKTLLKCAYFAYINNDRVFLAIFQKELSSNIDLIFNDFLKRVFNFSEESSWQALELFLTLGAKFDDETKNSYFLIDSILLNQRNSFLLLLQTNINKEFLDDDGDNALIIAAITDNTEDKFYFRNLLPLYEIGNETFEDILSINPKLENYFFYS